VPAVAVAAAKAELDRELEDGRSRAHFARRNQLCAALRTRYAEALGAEAPEHVAVTTSTTDGIVRVLAGLELGAGDEVVTSDSEHPGLLGPLAALRRRGVTVREVPLADVADAAGPETSLVACSHVNWVNGELAPAALADVDALVLLDGAQGVGAVPVGVATLGCDFYAGSGQKWMCGPDGTGMLWVSPAARERLAVPNPGYSNLADPGSGLDSSPWPDARAFDAPAVPPSVHAGALAAADLFSETGWAAIHERAAASAERLVELLRTAGREVAPRGRTTLVSWASETAEEDAARYATEGIVVRFLPGRGLVRASVGAWSSEADLERLVSAL
jgi:selenocysteine lyase/cysteine desulfurase